MSNVATPTPTMNTLPHMPTMMRFVAEVMLNPPLDPLSDGWPLVGITVLCKVIGPADDVVDDDDTVGLPPLVAVVSGRGRVAGSTDDSLGVLDVDSSTLGGSVLLLKWAGICLLSRASRTLALLLDVPVSSGAKMVDRLGNPSRGITGLGTSAEGHDVARPARCEQRG